jgi:hypothetical protein
VQIDDDDLGPALVERQAAPQRLDHVVGTVAMQDQPVGPMPGEGAAQLEHLAQAPEAQQPDAVLPLRHQLQPLLRRQVALAAVADVGRDVSQRLGAVELRDHALAVVPDPQAHLALDALAGDADLSGAGVEAVLHQLGERLAGIGLAQRQPADELERIVDLEPSLGHRALSGHRRMVSRRPRADSAWACAGAPLGEP